MATARSHDSDRVAGTVMGYHVDEENVDDNSSNDDLCEDVDNEFAGEFNGGDVDVDMNEYVEYDEEDLCTCEIGSGDLSKVESGEVFEAEYVMDEEEASNVEGDDNIVFASEVSDEDDEDVVGEVEGLIASVLASSASDELCAEDEMTPRPGVDDEEIRSSERVEECEWSRSDDVDVNDPENLRLAEELHVKLEDTTSVANATAAVPCSLLEPVTPKSPPKKLTQKHKWVPKPSTPTYLINSANKFKVEDIEKVSITTKGKAAKLAAAKIEMMASKMKEGKLKLKAESEQNKLTTQQLRTQVVAAEKARVNAAKKARELEVERIRLEAIARRKQEMNAKDRLMGLFEQKKSLLRQARQAVIKKNKDEAV